LRYRVQGLVRFYAAQEAADPQACYTLLGIMDFTGYGKNPGLEAGAHRERKAGETPSWSAIKALFR
jgi:hypothetical protein